MNLVQRATNAVVRLFKAQPGRLSSVDSSRGWFTLHDSAGPFSWQQDTEINRDAVLANWALFSCLTLITGDVGKCSIKLMEKIDGIWTETESAAFSPVLRKPNTYQSRQQFIEAWMLSKLTYGNAFILKQRDQRGIVTGLYVLDPRRVQTLVAENGDVYYQLNRDELSKLTEDFPAVPASEVIHDRFNCLHHPLQGLSPIFACGLSAVQGLSIQKNSSKFFENMSRPSGILTAPGAISDATAERLKTNWQTNYTGASFGKIAVLGDGLRFDALAATAVDSQLVEQMKLTAEMIASTFHIPAFKIGAGLIPSGQKVAELNEIYYSDCLHALMDAVATGLTDGLGLDSPIAGRWMCVKFELDDLLKMDASSLMNAIKVGIDAAVMTPNEGRKKVNLPPLLGGDTVYMQQQDFPLDQVRLNKIDQAPAASPEVDAEPEDEEGPQEKTYRILNGLNRKDLAAELLH